MCEPRDLVPSLRDEFDGLSEGRKLAEGEGSCECELCRPLRAMISSSSLTRLRRDAISSSGLSEESDASLGRFLPRGILGSLRHSSCMPLAMH